jgi:YD repeat-containing protein
MRLVNGIVAAITASAALAGPAFAGSMEARIGNTVVVTAPDGSTTKLYYNADKTLTVKSEADGKVVLETKGTWRQDGENLCVTSEAAFGPFEAAKERCMPLAGDKVGDTWQAPAKDADGNDITITVAIVAGR